MSYLTDIKKVRNSIDDNKFRLNLIMIYRMISKTKFYPQLPFLKKKDFYVISYT